MAREYALGSRSARSGVPEREIPFDWPGLALPVAPVTEACSGRPRRHWSSFTRITQDQVGFEPGTPVAMAPAGFAQLDGPTP